MSKSLINIDTGSGTGIKMNTDSLKREKRTRKSWGKKKKKLRYRH